MGTQFPPPKKEHSPQFSAMSIVAKRLYTCMYQDTIWYGGRPQPTRHCIRWGPSSPPLKGHSPQFSTNVCCGQMAGWTNIPLGMEVGLGPGDFVFDANLASPQKKRHSPLPIFGPCLLWQNGWMDQDTTWYGGNRGPGHVVLDGVRRSSP